MLVLVSSCSSTMTMCIMLLSLYWVLLHWAHFTVRSVTPRSHCLYQPFSHLVLLKGDIISAIRWKAVLT